MSGFPIDVFLISCVIGAGAGTLAGLLGVGGGIFIVPGLIWLLTFENIAPATAVHIAMGTALATMTLTSIRSSFSHAKRGAISWPIFFKLLPGIVIGSITAAAISDFVSGMWLEVAFSLLILSIAYRMILNQNSVATFQLPGRKGCFGLGLLIGGKSGLLGIGGGAITIPVLALSSVPLRTAMGVSAVCGIPISFFATLGLFLFFQNPPGLPPFHWGYVYWPAWAGVVIGSIACVPIGAWLSLKCDRLMLQRIFGSFLILTALQLLYGVWHAGLSAGS